MAFGEEHRPSAVVVDTDGEDVGDEGMDDGMDHGVGEVVAFVDCNGELLA